MKRLALLLIVMAAVVVAFALVTPERIPNLASIGTRVPGFNTSSTIFLGRGWITRDEIEIYDPQPVGGPSRQILNVDTGSQAPHSAVSGFIYRSRTGDSFMTPDMTRRLNRSLTRWVLTDLKGKELMAWPMRDNDPYWAPDGKSWVSIDQSRHRITRYTMDSGRPTSLRLPQRNAEPLAYDGKETVISVQQGGAPTRLCFTTFTGQTTSRDVTMPPGTSQIFEVKASPQGDRIGWYIGRGGRTTTWVEKLLQFFRIGGTPSSGAGRNAPYVNTEGIWVSRLDGTGMRPVGEVAAEWAPVGMGSFTWRPDGKQVLITYRNGIYRIPVD